MNKLIYLIHCQKFLPKIAKFHFYKSIQSQTCIESNWWLQFLVWLYRWSKNLRNGNEMNFANDFEGWNNSGSSLKLACYRCLVPYTIAVHHHHCNVHYIPCTIIYSHILPIVPVGWDYHRAFPYFLQTVDSTQKGFVHTKSNYGETMFFVVKALKAESKTLKLSWSR